jgi:hypothetical protein
MVLSRAGLITSDLAILLLELPVNVQYQMEVETNARIEDTNVIAVVLRVRFTAMWDPRISLVVSIVALAALGVERFFRKEE